MSNNSSSDSGCGSLIATILVVIFMGFLGYSWAIQLIAGSADKAQWWQHLLAIILALPLVYFIYVILPNILVFLLKLIGALFTASAGVIVGYVMLNAGLTLWISAAGVGFGIAGLIFAGRIKEYKEGARLWAFNALSGFLVCIVMIVLGAVLGVNKYVVNAAPAPTAAAEIIETSTLTADTAPTALTTTSAVEIIDTIAPTNTIQSRGATSVPPTLDALEAAQMTVTYATLSPLDAAQMTVNAATRAVATAAPGS